MDGWMVSHQQCRLSVRSPFSTMRLHRFKEMPDVKLLHISLTVQPELDLFEHCLLSRLLGTRNTERYQ